MKPGTVCRVRTDIDPALPWAAPGSIVEIVGNNRLLLTARLLFGAYRDESREQYAEREGYLIFDPEELEELE